MHCTISLVGNSTAAATLDTTKNGTPVSNFTIAYNEFDASGQRTTFIEVKAWNGNAERAAKLIARGSEVALTGRLTFVNEEFTDKSGARVKRSRPIIHVNSFRVCGTRKPAQPDEAPPAIEELAS